ncbi:MarR family winged helix-turn-helix transcriptional regulator [Lignipirellula cremea]|uniref:Multiple antibiotic resistance protein MarR n=1 Tax=Lignipirellula cremea TaxID=2528010 RepID=A0A518DLJ2_9BACT|nr:MarR family transcriptional regulator [Lignipirellula cremea]QDU92708.1 Multiple antibiotic resistance protein MarR [Lignipirellula cremea]
MPVPYRETLQMRLRSAYFALHRHSNRHFTQYETTADQYVLLSYLAEEDRITQQELSLRCASDPRTIGSMLSLLESKGWIAREPHPEDRRAWLVCLTPQGRSWHAELRQNSEAIRDTLYQALPPQELETVLHALDKIAGAFLTTNTPPVALKD